MKRVRVKICGITIKEQALAIAALNVDALGFILYQKSPRYIKPNKIRSIINVLPPFVKTVGVFVNESIADLTEIMLQSGLDLAQLSGDESPDYCRQLTENGISWIRSFRIRDPADLDQTALFPANYILLDAWSDKDFGGTGKTFDWHIIDQLPDRYEIILAGGINLENVEKAIKSVQPYGIDVSSGVEESPGVKSIEKVKALLKRIRMSEEQK
ncbi:MAG: phosphoribosylanthranilate isomerase [Deltaproteobacteria bacterium]|jgi:phosphoribosylanthranilate isomerase|nr:phosphoribosylanthranilate isomerase [Deltaproteobacteria bacterium]MBT4264869.1 phosphoribosylanthranilate isomerase [Deltaproteobacteria bacterium]MBT4640045.1 phosphoribosylanthranilate isomerase [Deltaproteobacteria bacterium]MBT6610508.1 phosphoribosylanthranilate isomerase [Deltaproteobacteria bacterium]MBT7153182.1 phosphoribosylanthranilate isomerase [Deltaproteobacteria bacterium]